MTIVMIRFGDMRPLSTSAIPAPRMDSAAFVAKKALYPNELKPKKSM